MMLCTRAEFPPGRNAEWSHVGDGKQSGAMGAVSCISGKMPIACRLVMVKDGPLAVWHDARNLDPNAAGSRSAEMQTRTNA